MPADRLDFYRVSSLDGFSGFLTSAGRPHCIPFSRVERHEGGSEAFSIEALREAETRGVFDHTVSRKVTYTPGRPVRITGGHFAGFLAEVLQAPDEAGRLRVLLQGILGGKPWPMKATVDQIAAA